MVWVATLKPKGNPYQLNQAKLMAWKQEKATAIIERVLATAPMDTGLLRSSFEWHATPDGFTVGTYTKYASYPEFGTGPRIFPTHSEYLVFEIDGVTIYARSVRGQKALHYFRDAVQSVFPGAKINVHRS